MSKISTDAVDPARLVATAERLMRDHDLRAAVVMAQTAIEVATDTVVSRAFSARGVQNLHSPVLASFRGCSLANRRFYDLYVALTGDDLKRQQAELWRAFQSHLGRRNKIVHSGSRTTAKAAEESVQVAAAMVEHLAEVAARL